MGSVSKNVGPKNGNTRRSLYGHHKVLLSINFCLSPQLEMPLLNTINILIHTKNIYLLLVHSYTRWFDLHVPVGGENGKVIVLIDSLGYFQSGCIVVSNAERVMHLAFASRTDYENKI